MFSVFKGAANAVGRLGSSQANRPSLLRMTTATQGGPNNLSSGSSDDFRKLEVVRSNLKTWTADLKKIRGDYERVDRRIMNLEGQESKLSQKIKVLEKKLIDTLGQDDYMFLHAFLDKNDEIVTDEDFEYRFHCPPKDIDRSIRQLYPSFKMLLNAEEFLELTKQDIIAGQQRLSQLWEDFDHSTKEIEGLMSNLRKLEAHLNKVATKFKQGLPTLLQDELKWNTRSTYLVNYPVSPMRVRTMSIDHYLNYCRRRGYIDTLNQLSTKIDLTQILRCIGGRRLYTKNSVGNAFLPLLHTIELAMEEIPNKKVPVGMSPFTVEFSNPLALGKMDFLISCNILGKDLQFSSPLLAPREPPRKPLIIGQYTSPNFPTTDLGSKYCDYGCDGVGCTSQRHKNHSVIRELYSCMHLNGVLVGISSNYKHTQVFIRDCEGNLLITEPVAYDSVGDMENGRISTMELLSLAVLLAADKDGWILNLLEIWSWFAVVVKKDPKTHAV